MVKETMAAVENNRMMTQEELFKPKPQKQVYQWTHKVQGHDEARKEIQGYQTSRAESSQVI